MNYQHSYHAGNFADVFKHSILTRVIQHLLKKPAPFCYLDTHAGAGFYDLQSDHARKTQEADEGVKQLLAYRGVFPSELDLYVKYAREALSMEGYPGSPDFAALLMRDEDRLILNEWHLDTCQALKAYFAGGQKDQYRDARGRDSRVSIHQRDAYEFLPAVLPPAQGRGVVLIDPPFEKNDESDQMAKVLKKALKKFRQGVYLLWYPITDKKPVFQLHPELFEILKGFEVCVPVIYMRQPGVDPQGLIGTFMVIVNPPFGLERDLEILLPFFATCLGVKGQARWEIKKDIVNSEDFV